MRPVFTNQDAKISQKEPMPMGGAQKNRDKPGRTNSCRYTRKQNSLLNKCLAGCLCEWAHLESNQAPTDYESVALTE